MASRPIDLLRALLDHLDGDDRSQQLAFFQGILEVGPAAVEELNGRLPGSRAPKALRRLAMEASFYYPWPGWVHIHSRLLRYEADYDIFVTGVRALGRVGTDEALEALRELNSMRQGAEFKETLAEVLSQTDPTEAFNHYLCRLLQGSSNAGIANEAAQRLMQLVDANSIPHLSTLTQHPDLLVFRHAIVLLAHVYTPEAAETLRALFATSHREVLADRLLKDALATLRVLPPAAAGEAAEEGLKGLGDASEETLHILGTFYQDVLDAVLDGKGGQLAGLITQATEAMHVRSRRLAFALDAGAEGLAELVGRRLIDGVEVLDLLVQAYREQTGREGVARALARLAPAQAREVHQLILDGPDGAQRAAAVEVLGARREPALQPVLLQACRDALTDIADRARFYLGQLPDAEALASDLLHAASPVDFQLGLKLVAERRFQSLAPELLELLHGATREDLVLQLIEALGEVGAAQATEPLLAMLHSGQSARVQTAIAQALQRLGSPQVARALCAKADELKLPILNAIAAEMLIAAEGVGGNHMPAETAPLLMGQVRKAWNDRNPWAIRLRLVQALQTLGLDVPAFWLELAALVNEALAEKRSPSAWSTDELHQIQAAARDFAKLGGQ
jgi:HEAT repeat protein